MREEYLCFDENDNSPENRNFGKNISKRSMMSQIVNPPIPTLFIGVRSPIKSSETIKMSPKLVGTFSNGTSISRMDFSLNSQYIIVVNLGGLLTLLSVPKMLASPIDDKITHHSYHQFLWVHDGELLLGETVLAHETWLYLWCAKTGKLLDSQRMGCVIHRSAVSPDFKFFVGCSLNGPLTVWNLAIDASDRSHPTLSVKNPTAILPNDKVHDIKFGKAASSYYKLFIVIYVKQPKVICAELDFNMNLLCTLTDFTEDNAMLLHDSAVIDVFRESVFYETGDGDIFQCSKLNSIKPIKFLPMCKVFVGFSGNGILWQADLNFNFIRWKLITSDPHLDVSGDEKYMILHFTDGEVQVLDFATWEETNWFMLPKDANHVKFCPSNSSLIAADSNDDTVQIFSLLKKKKKKNT